MRDGVDPWSSAPPRVPSDPASGPLPSSGPIPPVAPTARAVPDRGAFAERLSPGAAQVLAVLGGIAFGTIYGLLGFGFLAISVYGLYLTLTKPSSIWDWLSFGWLLGLAIVLVTGFFYAVVAIPRRIRRGAVSSIFLPSIGIAAGNGVMIGIGALMHSGLFVGLGGFFVVVYALLGWIARSAGGDAGVQMGTAPRLGP